MNAKTLEKIMVALFVITGVSVIDYFIWHEIITVIGDISSFIVVLLIAFGIVSGRDGGDKAYVIVFIILILLIAFIFIFHSIWVAIWSWVSSWQIGWKIGVPLFIIISLAFIFIFNNDGD